MARSTPATYRWWSLVVLAMVAATGVVSWIAVRSLVGASDRAEQNSGPVLVATQDLLGSVAEADATSTAVYLAGENADQRRLYLNAVERAARQTERVARLIGEDPVAHALLEETGAQLATYAGLVESARVANRLGDGGSEADLRRSLSLVNDTIIPTVVDIGDRAETTLDNDVSSGRLLAMVGVLISAITVVVLIYAQREITRRSRRLLNLPLVAATLLIAVVALWLATALLRQQSRLDDAQANGQASIAATAAIQRTAFQYKTNESLAVIDGTVGDSGERDRLSALLFAGDITVGSVTAARDGITGEQGLIPDAIRLADNDREAAATAEMLERWRRYLEQNDEIISILRQGGSVEPLLTPANNSFVGFNASVEGVLGDNRAQFLGRLSSARDALDGLLVAVVLLPMLAALLGLFGFQLRINEYR